MTSQPESPPPDDERVRFLPSTRPSTSSTTNVTSQPTMTSQYSYSCEQVQIGVPPLDGARRGVNRDPTHRTSGSSVSSYQSAVFTFPPQNNSGTQTPGSNSGNSQNRMSSSLNDILQSLPLRSTSPNYDVTEGGKRRSARNSFGKEWTKNHWDKIKQLEESSSQARRCSKLSSGFAPLMIFGGLVFVCIGVSANFNSTTEDSEKLRQLAVAPLVMGSFMLTLGTILLCTWFGCKWRAAKIDRQVLHGSRDRIYHQDNHDANLLSAIFSKLYGYNGPHRGSHDNDSVFSPTVMIPAQSTSASNKSENSST